MLSNSEHILEARQKSLRSGAGEVPQQEFQRLVDLADGKNVFKVDYDVLKSSSSGVISVEDALKHPQTIPFIGGEDRANAYLSKHKEVFGNKIGVWHSDDLDVVPRGRLLYAGGGCNFGLGGNIYLAGDGGFVGVSASGEASAPKK